MTNDTMPCPHCLGTGKVPDPRQHGLRLKAARETKGWTVRELARRAGCSAAHISDVEHGKRGSAGPAIQKARRLLGVR